MSKILKRTFLVCFFLLSLLLVSLVSLFFFVKSPTGQEWALEKVRYYLESQTETEITWGKIAFSFPLQMNIEELVITQKNAPILKIKDAHFSFRWEALWRERGICSEFKMNGVDVFRNPIPLSATSLQRERQELVPLLPFYVKVENIDIQNLRFHPSFIETFSLSSEWADKIVHALWHLKGMVRNDPLKKDIAAHLLLTIQSDSSPLPLSFALDMQNDQLSCSGHLDPILLQPDISALPAGLKGHFAFYTSASMDNWYDLWKKNFPLESGIEGHFKLLLERSETLPTFLPTLISSHYCFKSLEDIKLFNLKLLSPFFSLQGQTTLNTLQQSQQGTFKGDLSSLAPFSPTLEKEISGPLTFEGKIQGEWRAPTLLLDLQSPCLHIRGERVDDIQSTLDLSLEAKKIAGSLSLACHYQQMPWKITSSFDWEPSHAFVLSALQIKAPQADMQGDLFYSFQEGIKEGSMHAQFRDLKALSSLFSLPPVEGEAQVHLALDSSNKDQIGNKQVHAYLTGQQLKRGEWQAEELKWEGDIPVWKKDISSLEVSSKLSMKGVREQEQQIVIREFFADMIHSLEIKTLTFSSLKGRWKAFDLQKEGSTAAYAEGQLELLHPLKSSAEGKIKIHMQQIKTPSMEADYLEGTTSFHPSKPFYPFSFEGKGRLREKWALKLEGEWKWQGERCEWHVAQLKGYWGPYPLALQKPFLFSKEGKGKQFARLNLSWGEAAMQAEFKQEGESFSSQFKTNAIPSELFHFIAPTLSLSGRATFSGHLKGTWQQPEGAMDIQLHHIQVMEDFLATKPFIEGAIHLELDQARGIKVHSQLSGIGQTPVIISGTLPLRFPATFSAPQLDTTLPFHLGIKAEGLLDPYIPLFFEDIKSLSGETKMDIEISGEMKAPQVKGKISIWNGIYESLSTGVSYHAIEAILEGKGTEMVLTHFSVQDKKGQLTGTGKVDLSWKDDFPFVFNMQASNILVMDSDYALLAANGPFMLTGNFKKSKLQGTLSIDLAEIYLGESLPRPIKTVDVQYINIPEGELASSLNKKNKSSPLEFDLKLRAERVLMQGKRLFSEWKGDIHVLGTPEKPLLFGDLRLTGGELELTGKPLTLSQGAILFGGDPRKKTTLYVVASKEIDSFFSEQIHQESFNQVLPGKNIDHIHAEIILKGPIDRPVITFRSTPSLSQREVLSYILFNRGISDITTNQGDLLSESFISLNSSENKSDSDDFLSKIRNNMGIDRLDLITGDKGNPDLGLQVGKYLTPNVLVSVNQSMNTLTPVVAVEAKLKKNWKAQAESGLGGDNNPVRFSLKWKKDY